MALIIWKGLVCITGSESPVVVVLSESMEPGFRRVSPLVDHNTFLFLCNLIVAKSFSTYFSANRQIKSNCTEI